MLITLGNQVSLTMQKSPGNESRFSTALDIVWAKIKLFSHSNDYVSNRYVLHDAILLAGIYICAHPPEKAMTVTWDSVISITKQSSFRSNELLLFYALAFYPIYS